MAFAGGLEPLIPGVDVAGHKTCEVGGGRDRSDENLVALGSNHRAMLCGSWICNSSLVGVEESFRVPSTLLEPSCR